MVLRFRFLWFYMRMGLVSALGFRFRLSVRTGFVSALGFRFRLSVRTGLVSVF